MTPTPEEKFPAKDKAEFYQIMQFLDESNKIENVFDMAALEDALTAWMPSNEMSFNASSGELTPIEACFPWIEICIYGYGLWISDVMWVWEGIAPLPYRDQLG